MKSRKTNIFTFIMLLTLLTFTACSNSTTLSSSEDIIPSQSELTPPTSSSTSSSAVSRPPSSSAASSEPSHPVSSQSEVPSQQQSSTSATPDYQGLTQEQWNELQSQKEKYEDWLLQKRENEAYSGEVDCPKFIHLWWEDRIDLHLINYVGGDKFNTWTLERFHADQCADIYSFAQYFSITLDELVSLIETSGGTQVYDVETLKRRYEYFNGSL